MKCSMIYSKPCKKLQAADNLLNYCQQAAATCSGRNDVVGGDGSTMTSSLTTSTVVTRVQTLASLFGVHTSHVLCTLLSKLCTRGFDLKNGAYKPLDIWNPSNQRHVLIQSSGMSIRTRRNEYQNDWWMQGPCSGMHGTRFVGTVAGQQAWRIMLQVRIFHAKVRYALCNRRDWKVDEWGVPINTEDMAATLLAFATNTRV